MKKATFLLIFGVCVFALTSCVQSQRVTSESYDVQPFSEINSDIVGNIVFEQSDNLAFHVTGTEYMIDRLTWEVKNGVLYLDYEKPTKINFGFFQSKQKLDITLSAPQLNRIQNDGVGNITLDGKLTTEKLDIQSNGVGNLKAFDLACKRVSITSTGVGNLSLGGFADSLSVYSDGVGNVKTDELETKRAIIQSSGVGNVSCYASESIEIEVDGVGNVKYYGNPEIKNIRKDGVGSVKNGEK